MKNLTILDRPKRTIFENYFEVIDFNEIIFDERLKDKIKNLYDNCSKLGLEYPDIKRTDDEVVMKYDYENYYIIFTVTHDTITFTYGALDKESKKGILTIFPKQLEMLSKFLYRNLKETN